MHRGLHDELTSDQRSGVLRSHAAEPEVCDLLIFLCGHKWPTSEMASRYMTDFTVVLWPDVTSDKSLG